MRPFLVSQNDRFQKYYGRYEISAAKIEDGWYLTSSDDIIDSINNSSILFLLANSIFGMGIAPTLIDL